MVLALSISSSPSACDLQAAHGVVNGNSSAAAPPVKAAKEVYVRQPIDAATKMPAQMRSSAQAGSISPSMLSRPASAQSRKARDQHRSMLQVSVLAFNNANTHPSVRTNPEYGQSRTVSFVQRYMRQEVMPLLDCCLSRISVAWSIRSLLC